MLPELFNITVWSRF